MIGGGAVGSSAGGTAQSVLARNIGAKKGDARSAVRRGDTKGAWRRMGMRAGREPARRFRALSDEFGTGYVYPLGGVVRLTGQHYASRLAGRMVVTAEAESEIGQFDDDVLDAIAEVAAWYPRRSP